MRGGVSWVKLNPALQSPPGPGPHRKEVILLSDASLPGAPGEDLEANACFSERRGENKKGKDCLASQASQ